MLALYRLARDAGYTIISSLTFALFNRPLPNQSDEDQQEIDKYLARIAEPDTEREKLTNMREKPDGIKSDGPIT